MALDTATRIENRNRLAHEQMAGQGWFRRGLSQVGLGTANLIDRMTSFADNERFVFTGGMAAGALRGATLGALAGIFTLAVFASLAPLGPLVMLGAMALGAAGCTVYDGQKGLDNYEYSGSRRFSDIVAEQLGAVPRRDVEMTSGPEATLYLSGRDPLQALDADQVLLDEGARERGRFVDQEGLRRTAQAASRQR